MLNGWIKLHRGIVNHDLWTSERFTFGQAWIDLLLNANFEPKPAVVNGMSFMVQRGQIAWSQTTMSERWKWNRKRVKRFLDELEMEGMITQSRVQGWVQGRVQGLGQGNLECRVQRHTMVSICNYDKYQEKITQAVQGKIEEGDNVGYKDGDELGDTTKEVKQNKTNTPRKKNAIEKPESVSDSVWNDFLQHRKNKRAELTQTALDRIQAKAKKANMSLEDVMGLMMERGWQGFDPSWVQDSKAKQDHLSAGGI